MSADATKTNWMWSLGVWAVMVLYAAPLLLGWGLWSPLDTWPFFVCFAVGCAFSSAVWFLSRALPERGRLRQVRLGAVCWLPCFAVGAGLAMNRVFDAGPPATHDATYLGYHSAHKGPAHVRLSSWREPRGEERMTCTAGRSEALCPSLTPGAAVAVTVRQGALGWEWVERVSPR